MRRKNLVAAAALFALLRVAPAAAQSSDAPDPARVRVRMGPLWMNPTVSLTNLGIDQNVFNAPADKSPVQDFTLTLVPASDFWLSMGRTWVIGSIKEDVIWYQNYATERAANTTYSVGWRVPLNRLNVKLNASHASVKDRPGFEIDARVHRTELSYDGTVEIRALSKTSFGVMASRKTTAFDETAAFLGSNLHDELNRTSTLYGLVVRHQATPLTALVLNASRQQDRFPFDATRDSDSTVVNGTISFDPYALIKGSATFGYRDFQPLLPGLPGYQGSTASVNLSYTLLGITKFGLTAARDIQYSYDLTQPYYLETGADASVAQQLFGPVDIVGRISAHQMAYRNLAGVVVKFPDRVDHVRSYGGGLGVHLGKDLRLGFNVDKVRRESDLTDRRYDNLLFGTAVTYNF